MRNGRKIHGSIPPEETGVETLEAGGFDVETFKTIIQEMLGDIETIEDTKLEIAKLRNRGFTNEVLGTHSPEEIRKSWETAFSDPEDHNPKEFCYLVHGINGELSRRMKIGAILKAEVGGYGVYDTSQDIDLLVSPERVAKKKVISCSVIDQDHEDTFGSVGFILKAPTENVIKAIREDAGTNFVDPDKVIAEKRGLNATVEDVLAHTYTPEYNEVTIEGTSDGGEVEIVGLFVRAYADGDPVDKTMASSVKMLASRLGIPLIKIREKEMDHKDTPPQILRDYEKDPDAIRGVSVNRGGIRYVIDFQKPDFYRIDNRLRQQDMAAQEFEEVSRILRSESEFEGRDKEELEKYLNQLEDLYASFEPKRKSTPASDMVRLGLGNLIY